MIRTLCIYFDYRVVISVHVLCVIVMMFPVVGIIEPKIISNPNERKWRGVSLNPYSAGTDFSRQNLTSVHVRF